MEEPLENIDSSEEKHENPLIGMILMLVAVLLFILLEMSVKKVATAGISATQISWVRYMGHLVLFTLVFWPKYKLDLIRTSYPVMQIMRGALLCVVTVVTFFSLRYLQMVQVTVIGFLVPLIVAALSVFFLKEKVGIHRWTAICIGFVGVMIVIRPASFETHWTMYLQIAAVVGYAFYLIITRKMADRGETAIRSVFYTAVVGAIVLTFPIPSIWITPQSAEIWGYLLVTGLFGGLGHFLVIIAHKHAVASLLAPFIYTQIIWSSLAGYLQFGDVPDQWTMIGGGIVTVAGLYLMTREAKNRKKKVRTAKSSA